MSLDDASLFSVREDDYECTEDAFLLSSYTSRMAEITVSGSSNCMYSELRCANICFEFEIV